MPTASRIALLKEIHKDKRPTLPPLPDNIARALLARPSSYKPEYCQRVLELAVEGYSFIGIAGMIGIDRRTINDWMGRYPEFMQTCERAAAGRAYFWETKLIHVANTGGTGSQGQVAIFGVVNAARTADDMRANPWLHKAEIEHSGQISLSSVVDRMFERLNALANGDKQALTIEHIQSDSAPSEHDLFGGMDTWQTDEEGKT